MHEDVYRESFERFLKLL